MPLGLLRTASAWSSLCLSLRGFQKSGYRVVFNLVEFKLCSGPTLSPRWGEGALPSRPPFSPGSAEPGGAGASAACAGPAPRAPPREAPPGPGWRRRRQRRRWERPPRCRVRGAPCKPGAAGSARATAAWRSATSARRSATDWPSAPSCTATGPTSCECRPRLAAARTGRRGARAAARGRCWQEERERGGLGPLFLEGWAACAQQRSPGDSQGFGGMEEPWEVAPGCLAGKLPERGHEGLRERMCLCCADVLVGDALKKMLSRNSWILGMKNSIFPGSAQIQIVWSSEHLGPEEGFPAHGSRAGIR